MNQDDEDEITRQYNEKMLFLRDTPSPQISTNNNESLHPLLQELLSPGDGSHTPPPPLSPSFEYSTKRRKNKKRSFDTFAVLKPATAHLEGHDPESTQFLRIAQYCIDGVNPKSLSIGNRYIIINISTHPLFKSGKYDEINVDTVRMFGAKFKKIDLCRKKRTFNMFLVITSVRVVKLIIYKYNCFFTYKLCVFIIARQTR